MILVHVRIDGDQYDWFDGECEFPVLPPVGSTIRVIDRNANMRELTVERIIVEGVMAKSELKGLAGKQEITLFASEL